jgi:hypothetical protein
VPLSVKNAALGNATFGNNLFGIVYHMQAPALRGQFVFNMYLKEGRKCSIKAIKNGRIWLQANSGCRQII